MMRMLIVVVGLLALPALAEGLVMRPPTSDEETWLKVQAMLGSDDDVIADVYGVKIKVWSRIRHYVDERQQLYNDYVRERIGYICAHRDLFDNDPEALASFWDDVDAGKVKQTVESYKGLSKVLDTEELASLNAYINAQSTVAPDEVNREVDRGATIRAGRVTPKEYNDRACRTTVNN